MALLGLCRARGENTVFWTMKGLQIFDSYQVFDYRLFFPNTDGLYRTQGRCMHHLLSCQFRERTLLGLVVAIKCPKIADSIPNTRSKLDWGQPGVCIFAHAIVCFSVFSRKTLNTISTTLRCTIVWAPAQFLPLCFFFLSFFPPDI